MQDYPGAAGWKDPTVSRENAEAGAVKFNRMQKVVLGLFESGFIGTADAAAAALGISPFSCRPRCTELLKLKQIERVRIDRSIAGSSRWILRVRL